MPTDTARTRAERYARVAMDLFDRLSKAKTHVEGVTVIGLALQDEAAAQLAADIAVVETLYRDAQQELRALKIATRPDVFAGWTQGLKKAIEALRKRGLADAD